MEEEQKFLLWLCEGGIAPIEATHKAPAPVRRAEMLEKFSTSRVRDASVQLTHGGPHPHTLTKMGSLRRHPVKKLYSAGGVRAVPYAAGGTPWACASAFFAWEWARYTRASRLRHRGDVVLNERGWWVTLSDTDCGYSFRWSPFVKPDSNISLREFPKRLFLMNP